MCCNKKQLSIITITPILYFFFFTFLYLKMKKYWILSLISKITVGMLKLASHKEKPVGHFLQKFSYIS